MAKISYKESLADYVILKFKCNCGNEITTDLIPVKERYDLDEMVNSFDYSGSIVCPKCNYNYHLHFYDNMYEAYCEIPSLINDEDILYLHEIPYEYAKGYDNALIDYIEVIIKIKDIVERINKQTVFDRSFLLNMSFSYIISVMDAYLHNTFMYNMKKYDIFKHEFQINCCHQNRSINYGKKLIKLSSQSFQNLELVSIPYFKKAFGIDINRDHVIQNAVNVRNAIIHNNGRGKDGYSYVISESDVIELISHVESLVRFVNMEMHNVVFEKIIWPNILRKGFADSSK